jgi:hypothetical protein
MARDDDNSLDPRDYYGNHEFNYDQYSLYYEGNQDSGFDMWDRVPGTEFLDASEREAAFDAFYDAFVENVGGHSREDFFEIMNMEVEDFPWEDWREWMGYE